MSDWVGLEPLTDAQANRSLAAATPDGGRLTALESTRRFLGVRIEDEQLAGMPTANLEQALEATRTETRPPLVHLQADANGQP